MYTPPVFKTTDATAWAFVAERGFGTLIVSANGRPAASHLPFVVTPAAADAPARLEMHVARANPLHGLAGDGSPALLVVTGPDAYISPDWYDSADQVPTWNYVSVHLNGTLRALPADEAPAHVDRLSAAFEARLEPKRPWTSSKMTPARRAAMLTAIVPLEFTVTSLEAQWKLAQHKTVADRQQVARMLDWRGDHNSIQVARLMLGSLDPQPRASMAA
jgi:transcriptional regulator